MSKTIAIKADKQSANDEFIIIHEWFVKENQPVKKETPIAAAEASKSTYEIRCPEDGYIKLVASTEEEIKIGAIIAWLGSEQDFQIPETESDTAADESLASGARATRKAQKLMKTHGLTESDFPGSKKITEADVLKIAGNSKKLSSDTKSENVSKTKLFEISGLSQVWNSIIPSQVTKQFPYSEIMEKVKKTGHGITLGEYILYGCSRTLKDFPLLNAYFDNNQIHFYRDINISIAVNVGKGLRVPVIHHADQLKALDISKRAKEIGLAYMREELTQKDQTGGSFTLSDLSSLKVVSFAPVLNTRQSAILGICAKDMAADFFNVILAFDHRVLDGMIAAQFLNSLEKFLLSD